MADVGGPCKMCMHCMTKIWYCKVWGTYVEPDGPVYACADFEREV